MPLKIQAVVLFFAFLILYPLILRSQEELSTKSKKAKHYYEAGEQLLQQQKLTEAKLNFQQAIDEDPDFYEAYMLMGEICEQEKNDSAAVVVYKKAVELDPDRFPAAFQILADIEYNNGWYQDAVIHYQKYLSYEGTHGASQIKAEKNLANCEFALKAMRNPVPFAPINLGQNVNTEFNEYFPCLTADNQTLLFTRLLKDTRSITGRQEDFFVSYYKGGWQPASELGPPINTVYNEGAPTLSADGNILIFTACESLEGYGIGRDGYGRCDLFVSKKSGNDWLAPYNLGVPVNSRAWESQPSISSDGRTIYFVSNRNNDYDIWFSSVNNKGVWSEPQKLGPNINTDGYEGSVFIHPDNQTLYFSSDGHVGMGGLDIFMSRKDSVGQWGPPVNLGYPINSFKDDNSILISAGGELAMIASDRKDGFGGLDLYSFNLYKEARPQVVTYMKGTVFDRNTGKKLDAKFELTNLKTGLVGIESFSNKTTGEFLVCLPANNDYALTVSKDGYLFYSENFNLSGKNSSTDPVLKDVPLEPIETGAKVIMKNVFFETDSFDLMETSKVELNNLIDLLEKNHSVEIEIGGHTDNVGKHEYNITLSENRAKSVITYLTENGIAADRLSFKGYGETQPVDTNETEAGRANNRRTEFKVVE
jgi:outer membrane protein OmpA-like peptidoglycan-associated protein/tetratricopeptide (TPR) repeat protein